MIEIKIRGFKLDKLYDQKSVSKIWYLAWPVMVGQLLHSLMFTADMWFVSNLGSLQATSMGSATSLLGVIQVLPILVAGGSIALVARYQGADDHKTIRKITQTSMFLSILISFFVAWLSYVYIDELLRIFGDADQKVLDFSKDYLSIAFLGLPFFFYNATSRAIIQATGDTLNPVKVFMLANFMNIVLDYIFIVWLNMGIQGAALATVVSEAVAFLLMSRLLFKFIFKRQWTMIFEEIHFSMVMVKRILKIGVFSALQMITRPFTGLILFRVALSISNDTAAAFGIGGRMFGFVFIFLAGLGTALSVMVGQSLGHQDFEKVDRLLKQGFVLAALNMIVFAIPFYLFPHYLMAFFIDDPEVIAIGVQYLRITYTGVLFVVFSTVSGAAFAGSGDTMPPMLASLIGNWCVKIPLAYFMVYYTPLSSNGLWFAVALSVFVEAMFLSLWFKKGNWKTKVI